MRRSAVVGGWACLVLVAGLLAGCTSEPGSGGTGGQGAPSSATAEVAKPVTIATVPATGASDIAPGEPVSVTASDGRLTEVTLRNPAGEVVPGVLAADGGSWEFTDGLGYGKQYTLTAVAVGADGKPVTSTSTFTTIGKPRRTISVSLNMQEGETVGVGMPLIFTFSSKVTDRQAAERALKVATEPVTEGAFRWTRDDTVIWRPKDYWRPGTKISVDAAIYGKPLGGGAYGLEDRAASVTVGDKVTVVADGGSHQLTVSVNDAEVRTMPISMGKPGHTTPAGTYTVMSEHVGYTMDSGTYGVPADTPGGYRTFVKYAVRLSNSGIFYHSAPWSVGSQGHRNVSHGCINLSNDNAKWLMDLSKKGDLFTVTNSGGQQLEPTDGWSVWQLPWPAWTTPTT
ncbi:Ig-like domain-containing protein [Amycolatopsis endophytica]|uniref:Lipoprotein-anchoring transpeptidase ErfK/SrfK n=1 Tax=Amycolatopsis endophytica TaxID=860233 RepID=A0A853B427_9PSEU|nr:Ig-like domain-containing protein [Amycolatopsis endophytica]NYI89888.1 lipoprotein-anchoring transpeptidase ErfK/SrfK [Amycolatopsis endophytica]